MSSTPALDRNVPNDAWERAFAAGVCLHCGNALSRHQRPDDGPFCCRGCRAVYELIHAERLERYYDLRPERGAPAPALRPESFSWLDAVVAAQDGAPEAGFWRLTLDIQGVHCAACVWLLEELFRRDPAGVELRINPSLGRVDLVWDPSRGDLKHYLAEVERFGYRLGPPTKTAPQHSRALLVRLAVSVAVALNVMMFSLSYYFGLAPVDGALFSTFGWLSLGLATVSILVGGPVFFRGAWAGLRHGVAHLDLPISLGMLLAYAGSVYAFAVGGPQAAYFDSLTVFVALMLVGRWAQERVLERNRHALLADGGSELFVAKRVAADGVPEPVAAADISGGDELWIAPGDVAPVAGILMRRRVELSLDWITGESAPVPYAPGDTVPAGAFNAGGRGFHMTATETYATSRLRDLLRRPPTQDAGFRPRWWHRIARVYVGAVLAVALLGFGLWVGEGLAAALRVTVAVLVVTCPCALGLATPLAEELIHHALRRQGIFLRQASFLEKALQVRKVLFDKTGTLTLGELALTPESVSALARLAPTPRQALATMVSRSNHPVSRCLHAQLSRERRKAGARNTERLLRLVDSGGAGGERDAAKAAAAAEELHEEPGRGLVWRDGASEWRLGNAAFAPGAPGAAAPESTTAILTRDGGEVARFVFKEEYRQDAAEELAALRREGFELHLLSGDTPQRVAEAAAALDIPRSHVRAGLSPEAKAARVRELDDRDTLMIGDGLNDGPSFAVAFCAATPAVDRPVLPGRADFYFLGDGIAAPRRALRAARRLRRVVRDNLVLAVLYNVIAVGLCLAGLVTPVVAAVLMPASSLGVVGLTVARLSGRRAV